MSNTITRATSIARTAITMLATLSPDDNKAVQVVTKFAFIALDAAELLAAGDTSMVQQLAEVETEMKAIVENGATAADINATLLSIETASERLQRLAQQAKTRLDAQS